MLIPQNIWYSFSWAFDPSYLKPSSSSKRLDIYCFAHHGHVFLGGDVNFCRFGPLRDGPLWAKRVCGQQDCTLRHQKMLTRNWTRNGLTSRSIHNCFIYSWYVMNVSCQPLANVYWLLTCVHDEMPRAQAQWLHPWQIREPTFTFLKWQYVGWRSIHLLNKLRAIGADQISIYIDSNPHFCWLNSHFCGFKLIFVDENCLNML